MNKSELITALKKKFHAVNDEDIHQGKTEAGVTVWGIGVFEKTSNVLKKLNLTFYTENDNAYWGVAEPNPETQAPENTFMERVNVFVASKIVDGTIKFAHVVEISEYTRKALVAAILSDNSEKTVIVSEDEQGTFTIDIL